MASAGLPLSRRDFLGVAGSVAAAATLPGCATAAKSRMAGTRPSIVIFLSDDQSVFDLGCYGNEVIRTPNMDRVAAEGVRFTRAFTSTAMCAPSRAMMYTGLHPHRNGADRNHSSIRETVKTIPSYLQELGYEVILAGKQHIKPLKCFPFTFIKVDAQEELVAVYKKAGKAAAKALRQDLRLKLVEKRLDEIGDRPFCLIVATQEPHAPYIEMDPPEGYDPAKLEMPPNLVDTPETRKEMAEYYNTVSLLDTEVGQYLDLLRTRGIEDDTLFIYTSDQGSGFPFGKWTLYDAGIRVPFIARWPGRIKPGSETAAMVHFIDVLPTCIELAGGTPPDDIDGRSLLHVLEAKTDEHRDVIFATHTNIGIISGSYYPTRAIRTKTHKYIVNLNPEGRFTNVVTNGSRGRPEPAETWKSWLERAETDAFAAERTGTYQKRPAEELYDLRSDPFELKNLADDPAYGDLKAGLRNQLEAWMKQQGDPYYESGRMVIGAKKRRFRE